MNGPFLDLVKKSRSIRRFRENERVDKKVLRGLVELARFSPSGANMQPLKFLIANEPGVNAKIFGTLAWAGYLKDWQGPAEGERPAAYIVILCDKSVRQAAGCDHGIAAQSIMLGAAELGLAGCMLGSIRRDGLKKALSLDDRFDVLLVLALGRPAETVVVEDVGPGGGIRYYRDENGVHHVPKRALDDLILETKE
jgi:nitroreductase